MPVWRDGMRPFGLIRMCPRMFSAAESYAVLARADLVTSHQPTAPAA